MRICGWGGVGKGKMEFEKLLVCGEGVMVVKGRENMKERECFSVIVLFFS